MNKLNALVFVYGTLRDKDTPATHKLSGFKMYDTGRFPYITHSPHEFDVIYGNIVEMDDKELATADRYEGVATGFYRRIAVVVQPLEPNGADNRLTAYVYVGGNVIPQLIESGDWFKRGNGSKH